MYVSTASAGNQLTATLSGHWSAAASGVIQSELRALSLLGVRQIELHGEGATLDISGAWVLNDFLLRAQGSGVSACWTGEPPATLKLVASTLSGAAPAGTALPAYANIEPVAALGRGVIERLRDLLRGLEFVGRISELIGRAVSQPRRWRGTSIARHVYDTGITAIPIISLIAFLISVIVAYLAAQQLQKFGADIFVVDGVTVGVLREMGVLLTAIVVAGRSGSAFTAEIGAMQLNEEVDALRAIGVEPYEVLVLPRLLGLMIALPLLTVIADAVGLAGGALLCRFLLDMPFVQYIGRVNESIGPTTFWAGLIKAPVFALLVGAAGTYRGLQVRSSSRELGRLTTVAVVQAIFLVILADAIFAVIFMKLDF